MTTATSSSPTKAPTTPKDAIDILLYDDAQGVRKRKLILELQGLVQQTEFAEAFLESDGLNIILQQLKVTTGSVQGGLLQVLKGLLGYVNAIDQVSESPDLVEAVYSLIVPPPDGAPISLSVAKPTLEILIVICGIVEQGHKYINNTAKHRVGFNVLAYSPLIPLLSSSDLITVKNTLLFMNILMKKKKESAEVKAKKLLFRWKECGVLSLLKPLTAVEDEGIQKQLTVLQKTADFTIPRSWEEAHRFKTMLDESRKKYDVAIETLFLFQQQQAKMRLLKGELSRAHETIKAMSIIMPSISTHYHPTKRFTDGGGLATGALVSAALEPIDTSAASQEISKLRKSIFDRFVASEDFKDEARRVVGFQPGGGMGGIPPPPPDDLPPPPEYDDLPPPDFDDLPPPDFDDLPPPEFDDLPPPEFDDLPPPADGPGPSTSHVDPVTGVVVMGSPQEGGAGPAAVGPTATPGGPAPPPGKGPPPPPGKVPPRAGGASALQETLVQQGDVTAPTAGTAPKLPPPGKGGAPPPPPPPPGKKGAPPPPPPGGKRPGGAAAGPSETRVFYRGPAPAKKMKPLHWDKLPLVDGGSSVWNRIYSGDVDTAIDFEEFENMFSQKEVEEKKVVAKPKAIMLLDDDSQRNLSIMLHKLPSIPNIQRAVLELDATVLSKEALIVISDQFPAPEKRMAFSKRVGEKPESEYTGAEQYMAMVLSSPDMDKRVSAWRFTLEWKDSIASALLPMNRMQRAIEAVLASKHLPYYLGVLLSFGNMMNYGNTMRGNAPAISLALLSRLEMTKDNRGKTSLFAYLFTTVRTRNPDAMALPEELKPIMDGIKSLKWEDLERPVQEAEKAIQTFEGQVRIVRKGLVTNGLEATDPFVPLTAEFVVTATEELQTLKVKFEVLQSLNTKLQTYFGIDPKKPIKPEQVFEELVPFTQRVERAVQDAQKEARRNARKGQRIEGGGLSEMLGKLESGVSS